VTTPSPADAYDAEAATEQAGQTYAETAAADEGAASQNIWTAAVLLVAVAVDTTARRNQSTR
jgi:hypothetical protein